MFEAVSTATQPNWKLRFVIAVLSLALGAGSVKVWQMTQMPLRSYHDALPALTSAQADLAGRLAAHVSELAVKIGERNTGRRQSLESAKQYLHTVLASDGYDVKTQDYTVEGQVVSNIEGVLVGSAPAEGCVVIGAHYDSAPGTTGANDNASGVGAVLELARVLKGSHFRRTVRFVLFTNEEPPYFQTDLMGSLVYARKLRSDGIRVSAMISMETIGYYSSAPGSQKYPAPFGLFYPNRGDFIGFVANSESRALVREAIQAFRSSSAFPSEGVAAPSDLTGIAWSDHWSFWQVGVPAIMVTDTAVFRYPYYHTAQDIANQLDYERAARVVEGAEKVVAALANS